MLGKIQTHTHTHNTQTLYHDSCVFASSSNMDCEQWAYTCTRALHTHMRDTIKAGVSRVPFNILFFSVYTMQEENNLLLLFCYSYCCYPYLQSCVAHSFDNVILVVACATWKSSFRSNCFSGVWCVDVGVVVAATVIALLKIHCPAILYVLYVQWKSSKVTIARIEKQ